MNADGTNPITSPATPRRRADDLESLAIATVDLIRAGDLLGRGHAGHLSNPPEPLRELLDQVVATERVVTPTG